VGCQGGESTSFAAACFPGGSWFPAASQPSGGFLSLRLACRGVHCRSAPNPQTMTPRQTRWATLQTSSSGQRCQSTSGLWTSYSTWRRVRRALNVHGAGYARRVCCCAAGALTWPPLVAPTSNSPLLGLKWRAPKRPHLTPAPLKPQGVLIASVPAIGLVLLFYRSTLLGPFTNYEACVKVGPPRAPPLVPSAAAVARPAALGKPQRPSAHGPTSSAALCKLHVRRRPNPSGRAAAP
jgi:hypothetical protein